MDCLLLNGRCTSNKLRIKFGCVFEKNGKSNTRTPTYQNSGLDHHFCVSRLWTYSVSTKQLITFRGDVHILSISIYLSDGEMSE